MVELTLPETDGEGKVSRSIICLLNTKTMAQQRVIHWNVTCLCFPTNGYSMHHVLRPLMSAYRLNTSRLSNNCLFGPKNLTALMKSLDIITQRIAARKPTTCTWKCTAL